MEACYLVLVPGRSRPTRPVATLGERMGRLAHTHTILASNTIVAFAYDTNFPIRC